MIDTLVTIESNAKVNGKYYKLTFRSKPLADKVLPGQFLNIQIVPGAKDPFLRRPFSYYRTGANGPVEVLYEILGKGTEILSEKNKGDKLKVMGPLGKPFTGKISKGLKRILVAGGVGVPPLIFLAEKYGADYLLIGTKSKNEILPKKELLRVKAKILYATDDGSYGTEGFVTELLDGVIEKEEGEGLYIQTCGPTAMMKAVMNIARKYGIPGEASLDKTMACGVGACLGCMVKTHKGWAPSCTDGPVFKFEDIAEI